MGAGSSTLYREGVGVNLNDSDVDVKEERFIIDELEVKGDNSSFLVETTKNMNINGNFTLILNKECICFMTTYIVYLFHYEDILSWGGNDGKFMFKTRTNSHSLDVALAFILKCSKGLNEKTIEASIMKHVLSAMKMINNDTLSKELFDEEFLNISANHHATAEIMNNLLSKWIENQQKLTSMQTCKILKVCFRKFKWEWLDIATILITKLLANEESKFLVVSTLESEVDRKNLILKLEDNTIDHRTQKYFVDD